MNIWGLQIQIRQIIIKKKEYIDRSRNKINPKVIENFDRAISTRKNKIKELRRNNPKKSKKIQRKR